MAELAALVVHAQAVTLEQCEQSAPTVATVQVAPLTVEFEHVPWLPQFATTVAVVHTAPAFGPPGQVPHCPAPEPLPVHSRVLS